METKIAIGVPTNRLIKPKTAESILRLINYTKHEIIPIISTRGYNTSENRNYIAAQAVKKECSHLFFVDDDMVLPEDTLEKLLAHDKDIVGGVYNTKYEAQEAVVEYLDDNRVNGLFECKAIGTGCLLIKTEVFKKIPQLYNNTQGWFNYRWNNNGSVKMSHDWLFCQNARDIGFKIYADNSLDVKHLGIKKF